MYQKAFRWTFFFFLVGMGESNSDFQIFVKTLFKKFSTAWVFSGGMVEGQDPGSRCVAKWQICRELRCDPTAFICPSFRNMVGRTHALVIKFALSFSSAFYISFLQQESLCFHIVLRIKWEYVLFTYTHIYERSRHVVGPWPKFTYWQCLLLWEVWVSFSFCRIIGHTKLSGSKQQPDIISHSLVGWLGSAVWFFCFTWSWLSLQSSGCWTGLECPRRLILMTGCWDGLSARTSVSVASLHGQVGLLTWCLHSEMRCPMNGSCKKEEVEAVSSLIFWSQNS